MKTKIKSLVLAAAVGIILLAPGNTIASTLYAVIAADTRDASIGTTVSVDLKRVTEELKLIVDYTGLTLARTDCDFTADWVITAVNALPAMTDDDVVLFYYSGHGFRMASMDTPWPALYVDGKGVLLSEVYTAIKAKNPGLLLVLGDCCNSYVSEGGVALVPVNRDALPQAIVAEHYKTLYLKSKGSYIASGCSKGEYSYCNTNVGGYFTDSLLHKMWDEIYTDGDPAWDSIFANVTSTALGGGKQHPQFAKDPSF